MLHVGREQGGNFSCPESFPLISSSFSKNIQLINFNCFAITLLSLNCLFHKYRKIMYGCLNCFFPLRASSLIFCSQEKKKHLLPLAVIEGLSSPFFSQPIPQRLLLPLTCLSRATSCSTTPPYLRWCTPSDPPPPGSSSFRCLRSPIVSFRHHRLTDNSSSTSYFIM